MLFNMMRSDYVPTPRQNWLNPVPMASAEADPKMSSSKLL